MLKYNYGILFIVLSVILGCEQDRFCAPLPSDVWFEANEVLINVSMEDIYSPPVATRVFAYPYLIAHELMLNKDGESILIERINDAHYIISSDSISINHEIAAVHGFYLVAKKLVFSEHLIDEWYDGLKNRYSAMGVSNRILDNSFRYTERQFKFFDLWIDDDNYAKVKADDFYTNKTTDSSWVLTPPNYEPALEPNWKNMRPMFISNLSDFYPRSRPSFSIDKNSEFFKHANMVYEQSIKLGDEEKEIALHWDCNPNEYVNEGHSTYFKHKMSPPGHWLSIAEVLTKTSSATFKETLFTFAATSASMYDGIISCWDTKYSEDLIRPVTYINRYIDRTWEPFIQTPPFPEYTSGHSVTSGCASAVLERIYPNLSFTDTSEVQFGLPARKYLSIHDAGEEASLSRFYGGIHYRYGIDNGLEQGRKIGLYVFNEFNKNK